MLPQDTSFTGGSKSLNLAEPHSSQRMPGQCVFFSLIMFELFYLLKGLLFPKLWFP